MTPSTMTRTRRLMALGAAATLVLATGACSTGSEQKADTKSASATNVDGAATGTGGATTTTGGSGGDDGTATTAPKDDGPPIGTANGQLRADPGDTTLIPLQLDVLSIERIEGDTVEVRFTITNTSDVATFEPWSELGDESISRGGTYDTGGLAILDRPNDKKYLTLFDTADVCLCTAGLADMAIAPGESASFYADVTAPPKSVEKVDLSLPGFQPVNGLELS
ncbi:hypothetical protein BH10ACT1_BH10ACT1_32680 [soil metagenome]